MKNVVTWFILASISYFLRVKATPRALTSLSDAQYCDWPHLSPCQFDPNTVKAKLLRKKTYLYLTFDDGPNAGTNFVLDALAEEKTKAIIHSL